MIYKMLDLDVLQDLLVDMKFHRVAEASGLSYPSVSRVALGLDEGTGVSPTTIKKLSKYFIDRHIDLSFDEIDKDEELWLN